MKKCFFSYPFSILILFSFSNYRNCDTDFSKGFIQGIILTAISQPNEWSLPKRYIHVLSNLTQNPIIIISPANKSGGVLIMQNRGTSTKLIHKSKSGLNVDLFNFSLISIILSDWNLNYHIMMSQSSSLAITPQWLSQNIHFRTFYQKTQ